MDWYRAGPHCGTCDISITQAFVGYYRLMNNRLIMLNHNVALALIKSYPESSCNFEVRRIRRELVSSLILHKCHSAPTLIIKQPVASFTKEVNSRLAKRPLVFNGRLANLELTSLVKEATGDWHDPQMLTFFNTYTSIDAWTCPETHLPCGWFAIVIQLNRIKYTEIPFY